MEPVSQHRALGQARTHCSHLSDEQWDACGSWGSRSDLSSQKDPQDGVSLCSGGREECPLSGQPEAGDQEQ